MPLRVAVSREAMKLSTTVAVGAAVLFLAAAMYQSPNPAPSAERLLEDCRATEPDQQQRCYETALIRIARTDGPQSSLRVLYDLQQPPASLHPIECHDIAHAIGVDAYRRLGASAAPLGYGHEACGHGYYHGVMITMLETAPDRSTLPGVCDGFPASEDKFQLWHCLHGVGHGLLVARGYDVFGALRDCDRFGSYFEQEICATGLFMENADPTHLAPGTEPPHRRLDEPWYPCDAVAEKYRAPCFQFSARKYAILSGYDPPRAFGRCRTLEASDDRQNCYRGASGIFGFEETPSRPAWPCAAAPTEGHRMCNLTMAMAAVDQNKNLEEGATFCRRAPDELKADCFRGVGTIMVYVESRNRGAWPEICRTAAGEFAGACLAGAEERWERNLSWGAEP